MIALRDEVKTDMLREAANLSERAKRARKAAGRVGRVLERLQTLSSIKDIVRVSTDIPWYPGSSDPLVKVILHLDASAPDSPLLREIVARLHVRIDKAPHWAGNGLTASFRVDDVVYEILGYRPATCHVVETVREELVPNAVVRDGVAYIKRTERKTVCNDDPEEA